MTPREILDETRARIVLYGERSGTVDVVPAEMASAALGPKTGSCGCGDPDDCNEPRGAHA